MILVGTEYGVKDASKETRTRVFCSDDVDIGDGTWKR